MGRSRAFLSVCLLSMLSTVVPGWAVDASAQTTEDEVMAARSFLSATEASAGDYCTDDRDLAREHVARLAAMAEEMEVVPADGDGMLLVSSFENQIGITQSSIASYGTCAEETGSADRAAAITLGALVLGVIGLVAWVVRRRRARR